MLAHKVQRRVAPADVYTVAQVAAIIDVPVDAINRYLDRDLQGLGLASTGTGAREIQVAGLLALRVLHDYTDTFNGHARIDLVRQALAKPKSKSVNIDGGKVAVTIEAPVKVVMAGIRAFKAARTLVTSHPDVMGGEPCLRATRLSVYTIADLMNASGRDELMLAYPDLTDAEIHAARLYAAAHPRRGRPRSVGAALASGKAKSRRTKSVTIA